MNNVRRFNQSRPFRAAGQLPAASADDAIDIAARVAARYRLPEVSAGISGSSYFKDRVHYPFAVHYANLSDDKGQEWEIAYMDEFAGSAQSRSEASTIVLIHGRGVSGAYYGALMADLLTAGYRVIVPDIPHYGKSVPGNLNCPLTRSLDDVRVLFHHLLHRLGVARAAFVGHSLGGQVALGYALRYPEQVSRLILVAPAGLEEFIPSPRVNNALKDDLNAWQVAWGANRLIEKEKARTAEEIRKAFFGRSELWCFTCSGHYQEFVTQERIGLISAPPQELHNVITAIVRDFFSAVVENLKCDPDSLVKRTAELKMPIYLAMGEIDPFFPMRLLTGNTDLMTDLIQPFHTSLARAGNPPVVKIYRGIGHYVHTDVAEQFSSDLRAFLRGHSPQGTLQVAKTQAILQE